jgi:OmpA-OmpF porin, OOP family
MSGRPTGWRRGALIVLALCGCAGTELEGQATALHTRLNLARDNGAEKCAPVELAMAESHTAFAEQDLAEGDYYAARSQIAVADKNVREAIRKSPKEKCNPEVKVVRVEPPKEVVVKRLDTDGDGLYDDVDKCPTDPEDKDNFEDEDGCPDLDNDQDGILDLQDQCPLVPEDKDGFQDEDGCPDEDNDADGLVDRVDACPNDPEDKDGFEDDDGCPDVDNDKDKVLDKDDKCPNEYAETPDGCPQKYTMIVVTSTKIELKQTIYFDYNKSTIKSVSFPLLNEVAQALKDNPKITVRIEGHTDSRGDDAFNMKLSGKRAEAVRTYLIKQGVARERMEAKGYGETVPIADNRTDEGRSQNRRVEFIITNQ